MTEPEFRSDDPGESDAKPDPHTARAQRRQQWHQKRTADRQKVSLPALHRTPGRPSTYTPERAVEICERIIERGTVRRACQDPDMPSESTLYRWAAQEPEFFQVLARARGIAMHRVADDLIEIADDPELDPLDKRVRVDTRKWLMGKLGISTLTGRSLFYGGDAGRSNRLGSDAPSARSAMIGYAVTAVIVAEPGRAASVGALRLADGAALWDRVDLVDGCCPFR